MPVTVLLQISESETSIHATASALMQVLGGTVNVARGIRIADNGPASSGTLEVGTGTSSPVINLQTTSTNNFECADNGAGTFTFRSGTIVFNNNNFITGQMTTSTCTAVIGGFATPAVINLNVNGGQDWNTNGGTGDVTVLPNGIVNVGSDLQLSNNAAGGLTLQISGGTVNVGATVNYRGRGSDRIEISAGGTLAVTTNLNMQTTSDSADGNVLSLVGGACTVTVGGNLAAASATAHFIFVPDVTTGQCSIQVTGTVSIGGSELEMQWGAKRSVSSASAGNIVLISNAGTDAVTGTFNGLAEGDTVQMFGDGSSYTITYVGGDGNDVELLAMGVVLAE